MAGTYERSHHSVNEDEVVYTERICLKCEKSFESWGIKNRLCSKCRSKGYSGVELYGQGR